MKRIILLLSIWIVVINAISQNYNKLIQQNKYWDIFSLNFICYDSIDKTYYPGTDTVLEGKVYKVFYKYSYIPVNPGLFIPPFVIDTIPIPTNRYLREDTVTKQVFMYAPGYPVSDQLVYDFSLEVGDTLFSDFNYGYLNNLIVSEIDSVTLFNGEIRKKFILQDPDVPQFPGFYIEGIGGAQGLFKPIIGNPDPNSSHYGYLCVSQDETSLWGNECNWYFVGTKNTFQQSKTIIYPNPAKEKVFIEVNSLAPNSLLTLYATNGELIKTIRLNSPKCEVNLNGISPGIYIVRIASESNIYNGKLTIFN